MLAIVGATIGKVALLNSTTNENIILTENCAKISLKDDSVFPAYLLLILQTNFVQKQIQLNYIQTTLPKLGLDRVSSLYLPKPPSKEKQFEILNYFDKAFSNKQKLEAEAKELLAGIDDYLLNKLGIKTPDKNPTKRTFFTTASKVTGLRLDPFYYKVEFDELERKLRNGTFKAKKLKDVSVKINNGKTPASHEYSDEITDFPIIKAGSYKGDFVELNKVGFTKEKSASFFAKKGDIFILSAAHQAEYVGKQIVLLDVEPDKSTGFVGELICVRADETICKSHFLFSLLKVYFVKQLINREKRGQTSHIYPNDIQHLLIPLPPFEVQEEIAAHIQSVRDKAKQLEAEAKAEIEKAKVVVEKMILGEEISR